MTWRPCTLQVVGDDMFCTNPERIKKGIAEKAANAVLLKVNQIGTVTESIEVIIELQALFLTCFEAWDTTP